MIALSPANHNGYLRTEHSQGEIGSSMMYSLISVFDISTIIGFFFAVSMKTFVMEEFTTIIVFLCPMVVVVEGGITQYIASVCIGMPQ